MNYSELRNNLKALHTNNIALLLLIENYNDLINTKVDTIGFQVQKVDGIFWGRNNVGKIFPKYTQIRSRYNNSNKAQTITLTNAIDNISRHINNELSSEALLKHLKYQSLDYIQLECLYLMFFEHSNITSVLNKLPAIKITSLV